MAMTRAALAIPAMLLLAAGPARAQSTLGGTGGSSGTSSTTGLTGSDFEVRIWKKTQSDPPTFDFIANAYEQMTFFNRARCECQEPIQLQVRLSTTGLAKKTTDPFLHNGTAKVVIGSINCVAADAATRNDAAKNNQCHTPMGAEVRLADLATSGSDGQRINTTADVIFNRGSKNATNPCVDQGSQYIMLDVRSTNDPANPDLTGSDAPQLTVPIDGTAPSTPANVTAESGEGAIGVHWGAVKDADLDGYLVFCARGGELPVFADPQYTNQYAFCASPKVPSALTITDPGAQPLRQALVTTGADGLPVVAPAAFTRLDPAFLCSGGSRVSKTTTDTRISGLQDQIPYVFGVASVDKTGNASPIVSAVLQYPVPTRDFYSGYRAAGGQADGGFCAYGRRARGAASAGLLAMAAAAALALRRRR